ncbi:Spy/CpxP family protein refolding chaperone [Methylobacter sp. S3L5C]|uniref:Spy/CpxP family protein refolding chaperone n=1 Tax=Methylobacter sp. S3L5C TaxID=2839024 RepID=UPI001FABDEBF|nr:Spy/CpxP family protein refolding chaperone [Methylobacter sp. S3L5C]UOA07225.1 Spy/CpxP family protein refolding chaperone [Methylobacter sp. S3L5C]
MKHTMRITLMALAISVLLSGTNVLAETVNAASIDTLKPVSEEAKKCDHLDRRDRQQAELKSALKLSAGQESAWNEWVGKINEGRKDRDEKRKNEESLTGLSAPDRMEKKLAFAKEHIAREELRLAATKIFYISLSPEQRLTFDKGFDVKKHHSHLGKHGKYWSK